MVHASPLPWLPTPSVTHVPLFVRWQYAEPDSTAHIVLAEFDDAFVAALGLKPGGAREIVVRKGLAKVREQLAEV